MKSELQNPEATFESNFRIESNTWFTHKWKIASHSKSNGWVCGPFFVRRDAHITKCHPIMLTSNYLFTNAT